MQYRADIDGMRCLAVLAVVLCHAGIPGFPGGYVGVDIFFVISGFLITQIISREIGDGTFSILRFYERRARRIVPAILVVILACLAAGWFILLPDEYLALGKTSLATIAFVSNIRFFVSSSDYFGPEVAFDPLLHTWSLAVEEQFYLLFPFLLIVLSNRFLPYRFVAIAVLCAISFALSVWGVANFEIATFYLLPTRFWELGLGALLALRAYPADSSPLARQGAGLLGLFLIAASVILLEEGSAFPGLAALPACAGTALLIWSGSDGRTLASKLLSMRPFVLIGLISYSLYLWHWPFIVFLRLWLSTADLPLAVASGAVIVSICFAALSWRYIEQPFRRPSRVAHARGAEGSRPILMRSGAAMACVAALACVPVALGGFTGRLTPSAHASYIHAKERGQVSLACERRSDSGDACEIGEQMPAGTEPDLIIWGDSHALAMLAAFDEVLDAKGLAAVAYVKPGCAALVGVARADKENGEACEVHNQQVLREIRRYSGDETVILISRWALLTEGERAEGEAGSEAVLAAAETAATWEGNSNQSLVERGLDKAVRELSEEGVEVIVMRPTPEFGYDIPKAMVRQTWTGMEPQTLYRADYGARVSDTNAIIDHVVTRHDAEAVAPADLLCPDACRTSFRNEFLYRDDDHLSQAGAEWLVREMFERKLLRIEDKDG